MNEKNECTKILSQLKGHKHLIKGNHDVRSDKQYSEMGFEFVSTYMDMFNADDDSIITTGWANNKNIAITIDGVSAIDQEILLTKI